MTRYLISFDDGAMAHIPDDELPAVGKAAHAVVREAKDAGVWIHGGGVQQQRASIVGTDGVVSDGPSPNIKAVITVKPKGPGSGALSGMPGKTRRLIMFTVSA